MSLIDSPDYQFRAEDKALKMLFPSTNESAQYSFDDFFDQELYGLSNDDHDRSCSPIENIFASNTFDIIDPSRVSATAQEPTPQPWRKGLWCLQSSQDSDLIVGKTRKNSRVAERHISPAFTISNDRIANKKPSLLSRIKTKANVTSPSPVASHNARHTRHNAMDEHTLSLSPQYVQSTLSIKMEHGEELQQDLANFHLQMPDSGMYLSSPLSQAPTRQEVALRKANAQVVARNAVVAHSSRSPTKYHYPFNHIPRPDEHFNEVENSTSLANEEIALVQHTTSPNMVMNQYTAPVWISESLQSSDSSQQSNGSQYTSDDYQPTLTSLSAQVWMSPPQPTTVTLPSHASKIVAPIPQRVPYQVLCSQQEQYVDSLGIHYTKAKDMGRAVTHGDTRMQRLKYRTTTPPTTATLPAYPPLPPYPSHFLADEFSFSTPHRRATTLSRSPSPSISPTRQLKVRATSQRSPTRTEHNHTRRKSIHKPGPIKDVVVEGHRRTRSSSRPPKTPRTPKTPLSASFAQLDFVNFTPKDSAKLMADVAPSGSSKTRARREQEAKERRMKLNEAALQAVQRAGGDVRALEDAIFV